MTDPLLSALRDPVAKDRIVWRDVARHCLCDGTHKHRGNVTAGELADLIESGDERAIDLARSIALAGIAIAVRETRQW